MGGYPVIPYERKYDFKNPQSAEKADSVAKGPFYQYYYENRIKGIGSNNWAANIGRRGGYGLGRFAGPATRAHLKIVFGSENDGSRVHARRQSRA